MFISFKIGSRYYCVTDTSVIIIVVLVVATPAIDVFNQVSGHY